MLLLPSTTSQTVGVTGVARAWPSAQVSSGGMVVAGPGAGLPAVPAVLAGPLPKLGD